MEKVPEAQAHWLDQVSLKDRASLLEDQKALHEAWKADMQAPSARARTGRCNRW
jgi:hypothetical protein